MGGILHVKLKGLLGGGSGVGGGAWRWWPPLGELLAVLTQIDGSCSSRADEGNNHTELTTHAPTSLSSSSQRYRRSLRRRPLFRIEHLK